MKRLLLYISDGVGCRNFIYSTFFDYAARNGFEIVILKNVPFSIDARGSKVIEFPKLPIPPKVDILKGIKTEAELNLFTAKFQNPIYQVYKFPYKPKTLKAKLKLFYKNRYVKRTNTQEQILKVEEKMYKAAVGSPLFHALADILKAERIDVVMFTNQRSVSNITLMLAAEKMQVPSITNIFSWDNLPKGSKIHKSDYYFVWSQYMFDELLRYYPHVDKSTIRITGTPQFANYSDTSDLMPRAAFLEKYGLSDAYRYVAFTGDDFTSSPHDEIYLEDLCKQVRIYNEKHGDVFRVIFRKCPVDMTTRYNEVLRQQADIATSIDPLWRSETGAGWQSVYPLKEDNALLKNLLAHCDMVSNLGSTVAIDASFFDTPACYVNYQPVEGVKWRVDKNYHKIHFQTQSGLNPVFWITEVPQYQGVLEAVRAGNTEKVLHDARLWAQRVMLHPVDKVHERMWLEIKKITRS
jgi:hypothetical protein